MTSAKMKNRLLLGSVAFSMCRPMSPLILTHLAFVTFISLLFFMFDHLCMPPKPYSLVFSVFECNHTNILLYLASFTKHCL